MSWDSSEGRLGNMSLQLAKAQPIRDTEAAASGSFEGAGRTARRTGGSWKPHPCPGLEDG